MNPRRQVLSLASRLGVAQQSLGLYDAVFGLDDETPDEAIRSFSLPDEAVKGYVYFPMIPGYRSLCYRTCLLAHAFRTRGYRPIVLVDEGLLPVSPERTVDDEPASAAETTFYQRRIPEAFGIETVSLSDVLGDSYTVPVPDETDVSAYRDVPIGKYTLASVRKHLKRYTIDLARESHRGPHREFLRAAMVLVDASERLIRDHDIAVTVSHEPTYIHGGVPGEVSRRNGIPAFSHMNGFRKGTVLFGRAENLSPLPEYTAPDVVDSFLSRPLTDEESDRVDEVMDGRKSGENVLIQYTSDSSTSLDTTRPLVGLFTNLLWDASLTPEATVYDDVFRWISDTIDALGGRDDVHLVLKTHPAEGKLGTRESVTEWVTENYPSLPDNVTLLEPDTEINTYRLIDDLSAGIVYNSTVGLEMAYEGVPVVVGGQTHYRGFGFTYDPETKDEYRSRLSAISELQADSTMQKRARRYAHMLFVCKHLPFPYFEAIDGQQYRFAGVTHDELTPGTQPMDLVCDRMLAGEEVIDCRAVLQ